MTEFSGPLLAQIDYTNMAPCPLGSLSCVGAGGGDTYLRSFMLGANGLIATFWGILFGMLLFYGIKLLVGSRSDNVLTETKQAYGQAFFGAIIAGGCLLLANTFATTANGIVTPAPFNSAANNVIAFLKAAISIAVIANLVIQGIRLIVALEDGDVDRAKKGFLHGMIGAGIALLALAVVQTFTNTTTTGGGGVNAGGPTTLLNEIVGIGSYVTRILGALSVVGIIVAGVMLVISIDESLKDRARKLIIGCLVTLAISLVSFGIVELFIDPPTTTPTVTFLEQLTGVEKAYAAPLPIDPGSAINSVATPLPVYLLGNDPGGVVSGVMETFMPLANLVAIIILMITGIIMIIAQDENQVSVARKTIIAVVAALVLMNTAFVGSIAMKSGFNLAGGSADGAVGASNLRAEVMGFISFIEVPLAALAVVMIIISGIRTMISFGTDQGASHLRRTIIAVIFGIVIIVSKLALSIAISGDPNDPLVNGPDSEPLINVVTSMFTIALNFMALVAVIVIVIAGIMMIINKGEQDVVDKARGIIIRALLGLFVIVISSALVTIVLA